MERLMERLSKNPELAAKIEKLLDIIDNVEGNINNIDEAEEAVVSSIRGIGRETLVKWMNSMHDKSVECFEEEIKGAKKHGKKNLNAIQR